MDVACNASYLWSEGHKYRPGVFTNTSYNAGVRTRILSVKFMDCVSC